jgi:hypothetical protein
MMVTGVEEEMRNNLDTRMDQTQYITQVHPADSHAEIKMWYACMTREYN